jgi:hypothetical protein
VPIVLSGRVVIDDGRALPEPAAILRTCNGTNPHTEGFTDSAGAFQIRFGDEQAVLQDASETGLDGRSSVSFASCLAGIAAIFDHPPRLGRGSAVALLPGCRGTRQSRPKPQPLDRASPRRDRHRKLDGGYVARPTTQHPSSRDTCRPAGKEQMAAG